MRLKEQTLLVQKPVDCFFFFNLLFFFFSSLAKICVRLITGAKLRRRTLIEFEVGKI